MPENEIWRRNQDAGNQDLCAGSVPECDGWVIRYRKSANGLTGRVPENEAGDSE